MKNWVKNIYTNTKMSGDLPHVTLQDLPS
jgi:hypothetical protein